MASGSGNALSYIENSYQYIEFYHFHFNPSRTYAFPIPHPKSLLNSILNMILFLIYFHSILKKYKSLKGAPFDIFKIPFGVTM